MTTPMARPSAPPRSGGRILVDALRRHGVDRVYCVPGESYLAVLDALYDTPEIQVIVCRHEGAAANMAEADGKLTGRPGICFVTRGPGATHASVGVHTASQDSTPMILFIGDVERSARDREAFQEINYREMFRPMVKWVAEIDDPRRIPELVGRAFRTATSGRLGPVVLALPEDMLAEDCVTEDTPRYTPAQAAPRAADLDRLQAMLNDAERPLLILGGSGWSQPAWTDIAAFVERHDLPVAAAFRSQHLFDNRRRQYIGHIGLGVRPPLAARIRAADLLVVLGARLGEATTNGYTLIDAPNPHAPLVHVHASAEELGRVYQPALAITSGMAEISAALSRLAAPDSLKWRAWTSAGRKEYESFTLIPRAAPARFGTTEVMAHVEDRLADDAIVTNGAGNFAIWVHRFHRYRQFRTQLAPTNGAMGYGLPAAIAAKLRHPNRQVVCFAGDGDFMMYPQELITAVRYALPIVTIVINNSLYGSIRMQQERAYPGRLSGTDLVNPDFAAMARAFGMPATLARTADEFAVAFDAALIATQPTLIEVTVDPAQITPDARL